MNQLGEISFQTKYDELESQVWLLKCYLTIRYVVTLLGVFTRDINMSIWLGISLRAG